jgi:hypothetical protein
VVGRGPDVWQFRWTDRGPYGKRIYRKRVIGTVCQYPDADAARKAVTGIVEGNQPESFPAMPNPNDHCGGVRSLNHARKTALMDEKGCKKGAKTCPFAPSLVSDEST